MAKGNRGGQRAITISKERAITSEVVKLNEQLSDRQKKEAELKVLEQKLADAQKRKAEVQAKIDASNKRTKELKKRLKALKNKPLE